MSDLPPLFIDRIRGQFNSVAEQMLGAIAQTPVVSVHAKGDALKEFRDKQVPHYAKGFILSSRPSFTLDIPFHLGDYYPQESSSMIIGSIVAQIAEKKTVKYALDLCAAPGGKTILLHENLPKDSVIYANEIHPKRNQVLQENLMKWGVNNAVVLQADVSQIKGDGRWDLILLDAPCSGEGLFRKDPKSRGEWSPEQVVKCAGIQKELIAEAYRLLSPGGVLIYSTCTFSEEENQDIVSLLVNEYDMQAWSNLQMPEYADELKIEGVSAWRFLPHLTVGEGFFCTVLQKQSAPSVGKVKLQNDSYWQPLHARDWASLSAFVDNQDKGLYWINGKGEVYFSTLQSADVFPISKITQIGSLIGVLNKNVFIPHQGLLLCQNTRKEIPRFEVNEEDALKLLRGEDLRSDQLSLSGWHIAKWQGRDLTWVKMVNGRVSNHYPKEWRIRHL